MSDQGEDYYSVNEEETDVLRELIDQLEGPNFLSGNSKVNFNFYLASHTLSPLQCSKAIPLKSLETLDQSLFWTAIDSKQNPRNSLLGIFDKEGGENS